jgi:hypothetical protein
MVRSGWTGATENAMRIAISGHRPNRLHIGPAAVRARLDEVLTRLAAKAHVAEPDAPVAVSPLAEGSDRLFAQSAIDHGFALEALLPMPSQEYVMTFGDPSTTGEFHALLARARLVRELPGSRSDTKSAYAALGQVTVDVCDVLVVVWDGKPAAGRGGTPDVIAHALERGRRVIWVDAAVDRAPQQLRAVSPAIDAVPFD